MPSRRRDPRACRCGRGRWRWCRREVGVGIPGSKFQIPGGTGGARAGMRYMTVILFSTWLVAGVVVAEELLIVVNKSDHTASILEAKTGAARATVPVGKGPHEVEILSDGKTAAVSNYGNREEPGRTLTLIDLEKRAPVATIELPEGARPHGLKALSDGRLLVTAEGLKELLIVDPKARRVAARVPTSRETSHMVAASADGKRAYVANIGSGSVTVVDLSQAKVKVPQFPIRIKITPDGQRALVSCARSGDVAIIDTATKKEIKRISIDRKAVPGSEARLFSTQFGKSPTPVGLLIAPDGKRGWVASTNADVVSVLDLVSLTIAGRIIAGKEPDGLAGRF